MNTSEIDLSLTYDEPGLAEAGQSLAQRLGLPVNVDSHAQLLLSAEGLWLKMGAFKAIRVDFRWQTWQKRLQQGKKQDLIKACHIKPGMHIIDATAGWGGDSALMAVFGAKVTMIERQPFMQALLEDGLQRQSSLDKQRLNLQLVTQDAASYLTNLSTDVDLIYLDPMHPPRQKSALVKKEMQVLQRLIGPDEDIQALLQLALSCRVKKVVVKWPAHQPAVLKPDISLIGKTIRYDSYFPLS